MEKNGNRKNLIIKIIILSAIFLICISIFRITGIIASASEGEEKRLNALELRLKDYEVTIENIKDSITALNENDEHQYEQRLAIQQQLDLMIVGINELINLYIDELEKNALRDEIELLREQANKERHNEMVLEIQRIAEITDTITPEIEKIKELTVSGNELMIEMSDSIGNEIKESTERTMKELNETMTVTNTFLAYAYWIVLGLFVVALLRAIAAWVKDTLMKHIN